MAIVQHGTVGVTPINVDLSRVDHGATKRVQLSANYAMLHGPGIPWRPSFTGAAAANLDFPRTVASGAQLTLHVGEANALIAAGAATAI
jgi:hypothetical protein